MYKRQAIDLVELIYGIYVMGCINNGNMPLKQLAPLLYKIFGVDSKDCYRFYTDIKRRKNERRTYFIDRMQEKLNEVPETGYLLLLLSWVKCLKYII